MAGQATTKDAVDKGKLTALTAALESIAEDEKVDQEVLATIESTLDDLNDKTKQAVLNLPAMQKLIEKAAESAPADVRPGEVIGSGVTAFKKPYTLKDIYALGVEERYVYNRWAKNETPIGFGGFFWYLTDGVIYDHDADVPADKLPEGHGYKLPKIIIQILEDSRNARRMITRETEKQPFGLGVKFLETGWAGKDTAIQAGAPADKVDPEG